MSNQSKSDKNRLSTTIMVGVLIMGSLLTIVPAAIQTTTFWERVFYNESDYYQIGLNYEIKGDYDNAAKSFLKEIEINPENAAAYNELAWLYIDKLDTNYDEAIELALKAVMMTENDKKVGHEYRLANYLDTLGWTYYKKGEYTKAVTTLERAIQLNYQKGYKEHLDTVKMTLESLVTPSPMTSP